MADFLPQNRTTSVETVTCACGYENDRRLGRCFGCGIPLQRPARPGEEPCPRCASLNASEAESCFQCGKRLKERASQSVPCPRCGTMNWEDSSRCSKCARKLKAEKGSDDIKCPSCGTMNPADAKSCSSCAHWIKKGAGPRQAASSLMERLQQYGSRKE